MRRVIFLLWMMSLLFVLGCHDVVIKTDENSLESREAKAATLRSQIDALNMEVYWYYPLPEEEITSVDLRGDLLFVQTKRNLLYAIEPENGVVRWVFQVDVPLDFPPSISDSFVAFTASSILYLLEPKGGNLLWKKTLPSSASSPTTLDRQNVYVGSYDHFFYAFKLGSGSRNWRYRTEGTIIGTPLTEDPGVYFVSEDNNIYGVSASDGNLSWKFPIFGQLTGDPYSRANMLYVPCADFNLYCINRITGNVRWKYEAGEPFMTAPVVSAQNAYAASQNHLVAINNRTGREVFRVEGRYQVLAQGKYDIYALSMKNIAGNILREMVTIDGEKGELKAHSTISKFKYFVTNYQNSVIYMASSDGVLFAVREK
ncbi:MAG: PQQ-binding-like beta-propeller repeat protein [Planctomycetota bacterium]